MVVDGEREVIRQFLSEFELEGFLDRLSMLLDWKGFRKGEHPRRIRSQAASQDEAKRHPHERGIEVKPVLKLHLDLTFFHDYGGELPACVFQYCGDELLSMELPVLRRAEAGYVVTLFQESNAQVDNGLGNFTRLVGPSNGEDVVPRSLGREGEVAGFVSEEVERGQWEMREG